MTWRESFAAVWRARWLSCGIAVKERNGEFLYRPDLRAANRYAMPPRLRPPGTSKDGGVGQIGPENEPGEVEP